LQPRVSLANEETVDGQETEAKEKKRLRHYFTKEATAGASKNMRAEGER
jgi:hypothetical protein